MSRISEEHLKQWHDHGYVIVEDFLTPKELAAAQKELNRTFPSRVEYESAPSLYRNDYRGGHMRSLPLLGDTLNSVAVHPEIVSFVERALGTEKIALAQSLVWARYPEAETPNYPLHVDYMSNSLLYPNSEEPADVTFILYYVDVDEELGATRVVSKQHSDGKLLVPAFWAQGQCPELYRHERPVYVRAGSMLIYNMSTFHRLADLTSRDRTRYSHHIIYRLEDAQWVGCSVWANYGQTPELLHFMEQASPRQRELLGFPPPGHSLWNEETLTGVAARYPNMDMTPYLKAANLSKEQGNRLRRTLRQLRVNDTGLGAADYLGDQSSKEAEQSATDLARVYYQGVADYYAIVTGVPADYWLTQLLGYYRR